MKANTGHKFLTALVTTLVCLAVLPAIAGAAQLPGKIDSIVSKNLENRPAEKDLLLAEAADTILAGVPMGQVADILEESFERGLSANDTGRILQSMAAAGSKNLTVKPLTDKALEGIAKGVDPEAIMYALALTGSRLDVAGGLVESLDGYTLTRKEKQHLAEDTVEALATGVSEKEMETVFASLRKNTGRYGHQEPDDIVDLLGSLVGLGIDSKKAVELTNRIMDREDMESDEIQEVQEIVFKEHRSSGSTRSLVSAVKKAMGEDDDESYSAESESGHDDDGDDGGEEEGGEDEGGEGGDDD